MQLKIHNSYRNIVALCDSNLIGKSFEQGKMAIEIRPNFFEGEEVNKDQAIKILKNMQKEDSTFNIVGKESVNAALEARIIKQEGIIKIDNIPIALVLL